MQRYRPATFENIDGFRNGPLDYSALTLPASLSVIERNSAVPVSRAQMLDDLFGDRGMKFQARNGNLHNLRRILVLKNHAAIQKYISLSSNIFFLIYVKKIEIRSIYEAYSGQYVTLQRLCFLALHKNPLI